VRSGHRSHHNSRLVVTVDENASGADKPIPTIIISDYARLGRYGERINHNLLGVIEPGGCGGVRLLEHEQPGLRCSATPLRHGGARAALAEPAAAICEARDGRNPARSQDHFAA
jgi:hypothetical protein